MTPEITIKDSTKKYMDIRRRSEEICAPLETEDYVVQPIVDVSPPKWHLGHTTWFLRRSFSFPISLITKFLTLSIILFLTVTMRPLVQGLSEPTAAISAALLFQVYEYRRYVDEHMKAFLESSFLTEAVEPLLELGLNHEQQHQELLITDIKYILGHNPLFPVYTEEKPVHNSSKDPEMLSFSEGVYEIGFKGEGFCFDNELGRHKVYLTDFEIASQLVTNKEYLEFMKAGGYEDFRHWHAEGWDWVKQNSAKSPLYWHYIEGKWMHYALNGLQEIDPDAPLCHINFYEASAFASWKGMRLPTEAEWETASDYFDWGTRWEWTNSAYLPYPHFKKEEGAVGEYNGKFMVNQMVLRGASEATPPGHSRKTYRNFFQPNLKWQFTGIRLAQ